MGKKRTWRWVTRNSGSPYIYIWAKARPKPKFTDFVGAVWVGDLENTSFATVCAQEFKRLTGITVPTDRLIKVIFSAEVVE